MTLESFLRWFDWTFPPLMILSLPLIGLFIPRRPESEAAAAKVQGLTRRLWLLALISVAVYYTTYLLGGGGQWRQLWMLCFLQMPLFQRLAAAKNPGYGPPHTGRTRAASLDNRRAESWIPFRAWLGVWSVWTLLAAVSAWGYVHNGLPKRLGLMILLFHGMTALLLSLGPMFVGMVSREPEPMDPHGSEELAAAYRKHRLARRWLFFCIPTILMLMFGLSSAAIAWLATDPAAEARIGLYGGIAGSIIGLAGGSSGLYFGVWRARLNQQLRDLTGVQRE
jgi:hypothetical protein